MNTRRYPADNSGNRFNTKEMLSILKWHEKFLKRVFPENPPSLDHVKDQLKRDVLCIDDRIPLFFEKLYELREHFTHFEDTLLTDWSHDYAVIAYDSVFMTDDEVQREHNKIEERIKQAEEGMECAKNEIYRLLVPNGNI